MKEVGDKGPDAGELDSPVIEGQESGGFFCRKVKKWNSWNVFGHVLEKP